MCWTVLKRPVVLPNLELVDELGRGTHSIVFRARRGGRLYAVKVPRPVEAEAQYRAWSNRLRREAVALARVSHAALPNVMEIGETDSTSYVVMELASGEPLDRRLERGPLTEAQTLELGRQLASALNAIHSSGLSHRNVKPCNILFDPESSRVRLVDFGFASGSDTELGTWGASHAGAYSAPEELVGTEPVDGRADLFSLGCVLYECLAGKPPFAEIDSRRFMRQYARVAAPALAGAAPHLRPGVSELVARLLTRNPEDRYQTAQALFRDLEHLQRGEALERVPAHPPNWQVPGLAPALNPAVLVGRGPEVELLREVWVDTLGGHARVVVLEGAPGIGKSRLVAELLGELRAANVALLCATCEASDPRPFSVIRQLLDGYIRAHRHGSTVKVKEAENQLRALAGDFAPLIRVLSPLLSEVFRDAHPMPSTDEAHKVFMEGLAEFLGRLVRDLGPAIVFVDNAHWLDSGSRRVLARMADHLSGSRTLLLFAARSDVSHNQTINALTRGLDPQRLVRIGLQPLERAQAAELARAYLGKVELDADAVQYLESFTDYAPLSVLELLRAMLDHGALVYTWGCWKLDRLAVTRLRLPSQTAELVAHRIEALNPVVRDTLTIAAVLGSSFADAVLASVNDVDESSTKAALDDGRRTAFVESDGHGGHRFVHDVVRESFLERLSGAKRRAVHQRIAEALDSSPAPRAEEAERAARGSLHGMDQCYLLATHYAQGELAKKPQRVLETNVAAGQLAFSSFDNERALGFFEVAASAAALIGTELSPELEFTIAEARFRTGALEQSRRQFLRILARTDDPILRARAHSRVAKTHEATLDTVRAWTALQPALLSVGCDPLTSSWWSLGKALVAWIGWVFLSTRRRIAPAERERLEVILALYDQAGRLAFQSAEVVRAHVAVLISLRLAEYLGPSPALVWSYQAYALLLVLLGARSAGFRRMQRAEAVAQSIRDPALYARFLEGRSAFLAWAGQIPASIEAGARVLGEYGHWCELSEYCLTAYSQQLLESVRGRDSTAQQWGRRAVQRMIQSEGSATVPEFIVSGIRVGLVAGGRDAEAETLASRLQEAVIPTPPGSAQVTLTYGPRVGVLAQSGRLGEEFEAVVREVEKAGVNPARAHLAMTEYYVRVAHARVHQCLRASGDEERSRLLPKLRQAVADLGKAARVALIRAHHRAVRGYLKWFSGKRRSAVERDFAEAERLGRQEGAPWVLYSVHRGRAHRLKAEGQTDMARDEARMAEALARTHGSAYRLRWICEEFELGRAELEGWPESAPLSHDSETSLGSALSHAPGQLHSVLHVMRAHHTDLDLERQARTIVDELVRVLRAERGFLYLAPFKSNAKAMPSSPPEFDFVAGRDNRQRDVIGANIDPTFFQQVMRRKAAYVMQQTPNEPSSAESGTIRYSTLAASLVLEDAVVGVLRLDRRVGLGEFTEEDAELLSGLACQVPLALELMHSLNARGRLEEQERTAQKMEAVARMAGGIAHDFNNMLSAIRTSAEAILSDSELRTGVVEDVRTIQGAAERAEELTRQLLIFSRGQHLDPEVLLLQGLIERATPVLRRLAGPHIDLKISLEPELHPVKVDRSHLDRILANLVTNARDAMGDGGSITISARNVALSVQDSRQPSGIPPGQYVLLSVSDTGHGIDPAIRDKIFDPFFTTKATKGGSGLGLATTYGIVRQSGGAIDVESEPGRGTTLKIYLPRTAEPFKVEVPRTHSPRPSQGGETLLFVEDEPLVNQSMCRLLRRKGYRVVSARGGNEALELANQHSSAVDLLITDVMMPDMNGLELARELRKFKPGLKVLYTSGYNADVVGEGNIWGNRVEFLQKPVRPDVLIDRVRQLLEEGPG
jgi:signal transduction histidine kinase/CheY-like chemotaxis protein